ncbi:MAG: glycoside hydrolase family 30 protein [Bacteroidota bacterium]
MTKKYAAFLALAFVACTQEKPNQAIDAFWLTKGDKSVLLAPQKIEHSKLEESDTPTISVDTTRRYQTMDGFGYSLTGGSAYLLNQKLSKENRSAILHELFGSDSTSIGVSYLRVSIGASDLDDHVFSYSEKKDPDLKNFSLAEDEKNLIPVLKEILAIRPGIKIMGSPWSPPSWMKTNNHAKGGSLKKEFYPVYARYLGLYIQGMAAAGITIDAITIQNEPENPNNTPSLLMTAEEQADFIKNHLGPLFASENIKTKKVVFDHNCDHPEYPLAILNDADANKYVDGSAFHMYLGDIGAMGKVHEQFPDKNLYFTEQWTSGQGDFGGDLQWHIKNLIVGAPRNWSRTVLEWNLAADPQFNPHTDDGGCTLCLGALTIDNDTVTKNVSYYIIAHASKFVPPGSVRIESSYADQIPNVAFQTPDGTKVLIALNETDADKKFTIEQSSLSQPVSLPAHSVATFTWR